MSFPFDLLGSLGVARPDSRWLAYTVVEPQGTMAPPSDWLFQPARPKAQTEHDSDFPVLPPTQQAPVVYRVWATQAGSSNQSALLEESDGPLGSPSWRPDGHALAFAKFTPTSSAGNLVRGRFEIILKEGLSRRKVLYAEDNLELDEASIREFAAFTPAWKQDGSCIAITRTAGTPSVLIVEVASGKLIRTIENACWPVWSPSGSRLAMVRISSGESAPSVRDSLLLLDQATVSASSQPRSLLDNATILQTPRWSVDGHSILVVYGRARPSPSAGTRPVPRELVLGRVSATSGAKMREWRLGSESPASRAINRMSPQPPIDRLPAPNSPEAGGQQKPPPSRLGTRLDFDPETEECFYAVEHEGKATTVVCMNLQTDVTHKRFPPLDVAFGIGSLALSPDGRTLAIRFQSDVDPRRFTAPAFCDIATQNLTIPFANESIRVEWLSRFLQTTQSLLNFVIPAPAIPGVGIGQRPIQLPAPGEFTSGHQLAARIMRLARIGRSLCDPSPNSAPDADSADNRAFLTQAALYFDYLTGNVKAAESSLDELEGLAQSPAQIDALLGLRAQLLMFEGNIPAARALTNFLIDQEPDQIRTVEETPLGFQIHHSSNPQQLWGKYLSIRHEELIKTNSQQKRISNLEETATPALRPTELLEELNRENPPRMPFVPFDPAARLFVEPPQPGQP